MLWMGEGGLSFASWAWCASVGGEVEDLFWGSFGLKFQELIGLRCLGNFCC